MEAIPNLRPVEALWLLVNEDRQPWSRENALRAVLVDLSVRGLLEPEADEEGFKPTGAEPDQDLRAYERVVLNAIVGEDDEREMVEAVYNHDYEGFFTDHDLFQYQEREHSTLFGLITWTNTERVPTHLYGEYLDHLSVLESELDDAVAYGAVTPDQMPMVYAFPASDFYDEFNDRAGELTIDLPEDEVPDPTMASNTAAGGAAVIAASSAASCAAASSAAAASACAATGASAGGAAGVAGGGAGGAV